MARDYGPIEHVIEPWLTTGGHALVAGQSGIGSSFFALSLAYAIAGGEALLGFAVPKPRKVLYVDGIMSPAELQRRVIAIRRRMEQDRSHDPTTASPSPPPTSSAPSIC